MYGWIWHRLPGPRSARVAQALALAAACVTLLWFVVFPWLQALLDAPTFGG